MNKKQVRRFNQLINKLYSEKISKKEYQELNQLLGWQVIKTQGL